MKNYKPLQLDQKQIATEKKLMRALSHSIRQRILDHINANPGCCVTEIEIALKEHPQEVISQHLRILRDTKVVFKKKEGKYRHYYIDRNTISRYLLKEAVYSS